MGRIIVSFKPSPFCCYFIQGCSKIHWGWKQQYVSCKKAMLCYVLRHIIQGVSFSKKKKKKKRKKGVKITNLEFQENTSYSDKRLAHWNLSFNLFFFFFFVSCITGWHLAVLIDIWRHYFLHFNLENESIYLLREERILDI